MLPFSGTFLCWCTENRIFILMFLHYFFLSVILPAIFQTSWDKKKHKGSYVFCSMWSLIITMCVCICVSEGRWVSCTNTYTHCNNVVNCVLWPELDRAHHRASSERLDLITENEGKKFNKFFKLQYNHSLQWDFDRPTILIVLLTQQVNTRDIIGT